MRRTRRRSESGAVLVLTALMMVALVLIVAIVIDLGSTRSDRREGQAAVDSAATAGAVAILGGSSGQAACEEAFTHLAVALDVSAFTGDACTGLVTCEATDAPVRRTAAGDFTATIYRPVPDGAAADGADLMDRVSTMGAPGGQALEGAPCSRFGVRVESSKDGYFGGIAGATDRQTAVHAVALVAGNPGVDRPINLLMLNRTECQVFTIGGGGSGAEVVVARPTDDPTVGGIVALDSDASDASSCNPNRSTLELNGTGATLRAEGPCGTVPDPNTCGQIQLFRPVVDGSCAPTGDVPACNKGTGSMTPKATTLTERYTRARVDYRYNCKASYATRWDGAVEPWFAPQPIPPCIGNTGSNDYIDELQQFPGTGFTPIAECTPPDGTRYLPGNYVVNCTNYRINAGRNVVFEGGNVIFTGDITINSGSLTIHECGSTAGCANSMAWSGGPFNPAQFGPKGAWARVAGTISNGGTLNIHRTAVLLRNPESAFKTSGGGVTRWSAPDDLGDDYSAGPFEDLALWTEGNASHTFRGGGGSDFEGLFFGGLAKFEFGGSNTLNLTKAQFVADKMDFRGGATFSMSPVANRGVDFPITYQIALIR